MMRSVPLCLALLLALTAPAVAADPAPDTGPAYGPELQGYDYPRPVHDVTFESQRQTLHMAYLDAAPTGAANGHTVVLLHGKNFCSATWNDTITRLTAVGYRVVAPDQIGFCKSSKPERYQFSFRQLAQNTHDLLEKLGIDRAIMVGHSTGGMLAARFALLYPAMTERLVMVDPIGLEDWTAKGVPPIGIDQWYARDLKTTATSIKNYEQATYYAGQWSDRFQPWVDMLAGMYRGPGREAVAWDSALIYDMIMTQPIVYELHRIAVPTLLMVGDKDTTAIGKDMASPAVRETLGHYPVLAKAAADAIPGSTLVEFAALGHAPQMQDPDAFHAALLDGLAGRLPPRSVR